MSDATVREETFREETMPNDKLYELEALVERLSEVVAMDGGELLLVGADYNTGVVEVQLRGACSSCAISSATLGDGVTRILKERLSWVKEVRGGVDEDLDGTSQALGTGAYVPRWTERD